MKKDGNFMYDMVAEFKGRMALRNALSVSFKESNKTMDKMIKEAKHPLKTN